MEGRKLKRLIITIVLVLGAIGVFIGYLGSSGIIENGVIVSRLAMADIMLMILCYVSFRVIKARK